MLPALYHAHHNRYQEDIPFWLALAAQQGDPLLELGCGTGRVLIPLAQAGYRITGLDHSMPMLKFLQGNIDDSLKPLPHLIVADMMHFHIAAKYHLIILPCNTLSTLGVNERKACLRCVHMALTPGGMFAFSTPNPAILQRLPARSEMELEEEFFHPQTGNPVQVSSSWQRSNATFTVTWSYDHLLPDGTVNRLSVNTAHRIASVNTYISEIENAGMVRSEIFGDFDRSKYTEDSPLCVITAFRK